VKINSGIGISYLLILPLVFFISGLFGLLGIEWLRNSETILNLDKNITELRKTAEEYDERRLWLQQYSRIYSSLEFLSYNKLTPVQIRLVSDNLWQISRSYQFDPMLVLALISVESKGDPRARGQKRSGEESGAYGLMQVKEETGFRIANKLGLKVKTKEELIEPGNNLLIGTTYLFQQIIRYQSLRHGIIAYNIGPGALNQVLRSNQPLPLRYFNKILSNHKALEKRFGPEPKREEVFIFSP
jgi:soluble lytic murein transglycosylase-like protein